MAVAHLPPNPMGKAEEHALPMEYRPNRSDLLELDQDSPRSASEDSTAKSRHISRIAILPLVSITIIYGHTMGKVNENYANMYMYEFPEFYENDMHAPTVVPRPFLRLETAWE